MKKRLFFLSAFMLFTSLGFVQFSGSGSGTEADPYQVRTADDLFDVRNNLNAHYKQVADIDLGAWLAEESPAQGWNPIPDFAGVYDGGNHTIKGLFINKPAVNNVGLFGSCSTKTSSSTIRNLTLESPTVSGKDHVGTLLGVSYYPLGNIENIRVNNAVVSGANYVGGIIGRTEQSGNISKVEVNGATITGADYVGGIAGSLGSNQSKAFSIYNNTARNLHVDGLINVGGMVGYLKSGGGSFYDNRIVEEQIAGTRFVGGMIGLGEAINSINDCMVIKPMVSVAEVSVDYQCNNFGGLIGQRFEGCVSVINNEVIECYIDGGDNNTCGLIGEDYKTNNSKVIGNYVSGIITAHGRTISSSNEVAGLLGGSYNSTGSTPIHTDNRVDGTFITGDSNVHGIGVSGHRNIFTGVVKGRDFVSGIYYGYTASGSNNVCCADTISGYACVYRIGIKGGTNYAYNGTVVIQNGQVVDVEDGNEQGISYSKRLLMRKNTYMSMGYDFEKDWAIVEGETLPYNINQSTPPTISSCVCGVNAKISGTASGNGTVYVFVNDKMIEGSVVDGKWQVDLGDVAEGTKVRVSVETEGKKPSIVISTKAEYTGVDVVLDENSTEVPASASNVDVQVLRTIKANEWSTICLPFTVTGEQVKQAWGEDVQLASFTGWESEEDENGAIVAINVKFTDANPADGIPANTPMLIKVSKAAETATFDGVTIEPEDEPVVQVGRKASERGWFYGTYKKTIVPEENMFLSGNKFWYSTGKTTIKGYRGYFEFRDVLDAYYDGSEVKVYIFFDEDATGISKSFPSGENLGEAYNLAGQRVAGNYKGIVIENGKKILK